MIGVLYVYLASNSLNHLILLAGVRNLNFCMLDTGFLIIPGKLDREKRGIEK